MKKIKFLLGILAIISAAIAIACVLRSDYALLAHPKGIMAHSELSLIKTNIALMLIIIVPTFIWLLFTVWKYRANNSKGKYRPEHSHGTLKEVLLWIVPSIIVIPMSIITWNATHELDPYQPLKSEIKPLTIQVVALDWKWLFIYPEQDIAAVNVVQFPERTPIRFELSADGSPMNSFWIPELSGQIYSMTGMVTQLHIMADAPGVYSGRAAEINGKGFADMTFVAKSSSQTDFDDWIAEVKRSPLQLTAPIYNELAKPSENNPAALYSHVEKDLFNHIVRKY
ncbi:MAG: COX aromatic rich motif-containing protein [Verrucomicrobia bacterium]|nr:COX aromatic rich motif-containing protein [Verrucomicrobiota bacterium]